MFPKTFKGVNMKKSSGYAFKHWWAELACTYQCRTGLPGDGRFEKKHRIRAEMRTRLHQSD